VPSKGGMKKKTGLKGRKRKMMSDEEAGGGQHRWKRGQQGQKK